MDLYKRRPIVDLPDASLPGVVKTAVNEVTRTARRLIPYPGEGDVLATLARAVVPGADQGATVAGVLPAGADQHAASLISEAASILDAEMARGVLAARRPGADARYGDAENHDVLLRQIHDLVDHVAKAWPSLKYLAPSQGAAADATRSPAGSFPELKPHDVVRPGQRTTITMGVRNHEAQRVRVVPQLTDLLGSAGGRINASQMQCTPAAVELEPQAERDIAISVDVPADAAPGCYSGVLVVKGVRSVRAVITVEVVPVR